MIRHTAVEVPAGFAYGQTDVALKDSFEVEAAAVVAEAVVADKNVATFHIYFRF